VSRYDLVVFDWDGTLVDSIARIVRCVRAAETEVGLQAPSDEAIRCLIGLGLPELMMTLYKGITPQQQQAMCRCYSEHFVRAEKTPSPPFANMLHLLERLCDSGVLLAIATGKSRRGLDRALGTSVLAHCFDASVCADETVSKPNPAMLLQLLKRFDMAPARSVMVGDTSYDIEMAQRAGMDSIAVSYGAHDTHRLNASRPTAMVHSVEALQDWLIH